MNIFDFARLFMPDDIINAFITWKNSNPDLSLFLSCEILIIALSFFVFGVIVKLKKDLSDDKKKREIIRNVFFAIILLSSVANAFGSFYLYQKDDPVPIPSESKPDAVGDVIPFGNYPQDSGGSVQPIQWRVLAVDEKNGKELLISEMLLDCVQYNNTKDDVTWEKSLLRRWMNNDFYNDAFSKEEKAKIVTVTNQNTSQSKYSRQTTEDRVFALSIDEAKRYLKEEYDRMALVTEHAKRNGSFCTNEHSINNPDETTGWWWLRSRGESANYAAVVLSDGRIYEAGNHCYNKEGSVRPAIWIYYVDKP